MKTITKKVDEIDHVKTGEQARAQRKAREISLRAVAKEMGVSAAFLSDLELGRRNWTDALAKSFSQALTKNYGTRKSENFQRGRKW